MTAAELPASVREALGRVECVVFDFDGVFTDNRVIVDENGIESVVCSRADGFGLQALREAGIELLVLSTEVNPVVSARCRKLKLECVQGLDDKACALGEQLARLGVGAEKTAYVGNDINDAECLRAVGVPVVVADAHPSVLPLAALVTRTPGGYGAVRELCDLIVECRAEGEAQ